MNIRTLTATVLLSLAATTPALAQTTERNGILADASGRSLYTFDKDQAGKSNCSAACLSAWPAFMAQADAKPGGSLSLIEREGGRQWAVNGKPLYYFAGDAQPGDRAGDGSGGVWHLVPTGTAQPARAAASAGNKRYDY